MVFIPIYTLMKIAEEFNIKKKAVFASFKKKKFNLVKIEPQNQQSLVMLLT